MRTFDQILDSLPPGRVQKITAVSESFTPVSDHAARLAWNVAANALRNQRLRLEAANKIIAEQNAVIAKAHMALRTAFENMTTSSRALDLKYVAAVLAEIEGRRAP